MSREYGLLADDAFFDSEILAEFLDGLRNILLHNGISLIPPFESAGNINIYLPLIFYSRNSFVSAISLFGTDDICRIVPFFITESTLFL
ncbi:hypothetical protein D3C77_468560 [compost metagenome]